MLPPAARPRSLTSLRDVGEVGVQQRHCGTGNGLTSQPITAANKLALGYSLPADATAITAGGLFYGSPADASSAVVRTTVQGDSNLDGIVNFADLLQVARNYNATNAFWSKGDFDYNGLVNFTDLLTLARNYNCRPRRRRTCRARCPHSRRT